LEFLPFTVIWFLAFLFLGAAWFVWTSLRPTLLARRVELALKQFERDRAALESAFFKAAAASGKPRGLAWKQCSFQQGVVLARDRGNGDLVGLVGVTISFEAIEGGGMEDVEAVGNLRAATAVFTYNGRGWATQGRAIFNLEPREVLTRFTDTLDAI
jgi:hypothetical protein